MRREVIIPILNNEYKVIVCFGGKKEIRKTLEAWHYPVDLDFEDIDFKAGTWRGRTFSKRMCHPVIVLPKRPKTAEEVGTLAHEATHAIDWIIQGIGETGRLEEIYAHCVGAVVREVLKAKADERDKDA